MNTRKIWKSNGLPYGNEKAIYINDPQSPSIWSDNATCGNCGLVYNSKTRSGKTTHQKFHDDFTKGIISKPSPEDVVMSYGEYRFAVVSAASPSQKRILAEKLNFLSYIDTPHEYSLCQKAERDPHVFIAYCGSRAVGFLQMERLENITRSTWKEMDIKGYVTAVLSSARIWGVSYIWVAPLCRKRGISKTLFKVAAFHLAMDVKEFAWLGLDEYRAKLMRKINPKIYISGD